MFGTEHLLKLFIEQEIWVLCIMLGLGYMISVRNRTSIEALHRAGNLGIMFYGTEHFLGIMFYGLCYLLFRKVLHLIQTT